MIMATSEVDMPGRKGRFLFFEFYFMGLLIVDLWISLSDSQFIRAAIIAIGFMVAEIGNKVFEKK